MDKIDTPDDDPLNLLKAFTNARIALGNAGTSIPLKPYLAFRLAHAHARDAVYSELDINLLTAGLKPYDLPVMHLQSKASYREQYLQRPDLGRQLNDASVDVLKDQHAGKDIVIVLADGLSATAINLHAPNLLSILIPQLSSAGFKIAAICLAEQSRVAIADDIGMYLKARLSITLIGERPGLSSADSMGAYITFGPRPGLTDEVRNCISNIHAGGLSYRAAAQKIFYLVKEAFRLKLTGVNLKDNAGSLHP